MSDAFWGAFIPGVVIVLVALINLRKSQQNGADITAVKQDVNNVHTIVNAEKTAMQEKIDGLLKLVMVSMQDSKPVPAAGASAVNDAQAKAIAEAVKLVSPPKPPTLPPA